MRKLLWFIPILLAMLACNIRMSINPSLSATPTAPSNVPATAEASPEAPLNGTIMGRLSYPSEFIPPMRVVAFSLTDGKAYFVETAKNQPEYSLVVPEGTYYLVSYPHEGIAGNTGQADSYTLGGGPFAGGYTQMVPCGLAAGCDDHSLLPITVTAGQIASADPGDWYAPEGTFPPMPNP
jgi:hypothetical protein